MLLCAFAACDAEPTTGDNTPAADQSAADNSSTDNTEVPPTTTPSLWDNATYKENKSFGDGEHTLAITVKTEDKSIVFTIKTNAATVKDALAEHNLIDGEQQSVGYMMTHLNGIRADYEKDGAYWAFYQGGEYMITGIDSTPVTGDVAYEFVYTLAS